MKQMKLLLKEYLNSWPSHVTLWVKIINSSDSISQRLFEVVWHPFTSLKVGSIRTDLIMHRIQWLEVKDLMLKMNYFLFPPTHWSLPWGFGCGAIMNGIYQLKFRMPKLQFSLTLTNGFHCLCLWGAILDQIMVYFGEREKDSKCLNEVTNCFLSLCSLHMYFCLFFPWV